VTRGGRCAWDAVVLQVHCGNLQFDVRDGDLRGFFEAEDCKVRPLCPGVPYS